MELGFKTKKVAKSYFKSKLLANPLNYSFKDRLIWRISLYSSSVTYYDNHIDDILEFIEYDNHKEHVDILDATSFLKLKDVTNPAEYEIGFLFNEHMYMDLNILSKCFLTNIMDTLHVNPEALETLFYTLHLLKGADDGLFKYFLHFQTYITDFKKIINLKYLSDSLETSDNIEILKPSNLKILNWANLRQYTASDSSFYEECYLTAFQYLSEFFYIILNSENNIQKGKVLNMLKDFVDNNEFTKTMYTIEDGILIFKPVFQDIINERNPEKRYSKIKDLYTHPDIETALIELGVKVIAIPYFLAQFLSYMQELTFQYTIVQTILILLDYCKRHKINLTTGGDDESSKMLSAVVERTLGAEASSDYKELFSMPKDKSFDDSKKPESRKTPESESNATISCLDMKIADFKDGRYSFNVRDAITSPLEVSDSVVNAYNAIASKVNLLNKSLIRKIKDIKVYNTGGKNSGLTKGKLDRRNLHKYKTTNKIFCDNSYKVKESDLAFGIILDVSGSMHGSGIENGRTTLIILHETLKALGINHKIITHTNHGPDYQCSIKCYQHFKEEKHYNVNKNYNLANITAESGNCDSAALYYMEQSLSRVANKDKIVLMFSDGAPTECTGTDLKEQVWAMERKGIKVIGIGIDYESIKKYYKDYANGRNLKEMFDIITNILKEYVLEKKD